MNRWVVAALKNELDLLIQMLGAERRGEMGGHPFYEGKSAKNRVYLCSIGVGVAEAAITLGALMGCRDVDEVIMVGSAGAMPGSGLEVGDLAVATQESLAEMGLVAGPGLGDVQALGMEDLTQSIPLDTQMSNGLSRACRVVAEIKAGPFLTVVGVSAGPAHAAMREKWFSPLAENMEGYALALSAARFGIRAAQVRGISNRAGDRNRRRWNLDLAESLSQRAVLEYLR
jgi:futalosine hydrolase